MLRALGKYNLLLEGSAVRFLGVEVFFLGGGGVEGLGGRVTFVTERLEISEIAKVR